MCEGGRYIIITMVAFFPYSKKSYVCCRSRVLVRAGPNRAAAPSAVRHGQKAARQERGAVRWRRHGGGHGDGGADLAWATPGETGRRPRAGLGHFSSCRLRQGLYKYNIFPFPYTLKKVLFDFVKLFLVYTNS